MASGHKKPRNPYSDSAWKMGFAADLKKSSKLQHGSKVIKEAVFPKHVTGRDHEKQKGKSSSVRPYCGPPRELRQSASSGYHQQEYDKSTITIKEDELVRCMSNLPSYLRPLETGDQMREKTFNVGAMDWSHLERWKSNHMTASDGKNFVCMSSKRSIRLDTPCKEVDQEEIYCQRKQQTSVCLDRNLSSSCNDGPSMSRLDSEKAIPVAYKAHSNAKRILEKGETKDLGPSISITGENHLPNSRCEDTPRRTTEYSRACDGETFKRDGAPSHACNQKITSIAGASSSKANVLSSLKETRNAVGVIKITREVFLESSNGFASGHQAVDSRNSVPLVPGKVPKVCSLESKPCTSLSRTLEESDFNSCSGRFDDSKVHSPENPSKVSFSCPQPTGRDTTLEPCKRRSSSAYADQSSDASQESTWMHRIPVSLHGSEVMKRNVVATYENGTSTTLNLDLADSVSKKGRHPSPNRRFSFSLSRITRSFSFKESSSVPQLSAAAYVPARSGPATLEAFPCSEISFNDTANVHNRARASPLRRILDPLLKSKGSTAVHSSHADLHSKSNLDSLDNTQFSSTKSPQGEGRGKLSVQGHLLVVMKNGHPLFRMVVGGNRSVLAATKTTPIPHVQNDSGCSYTIYAIEEIKKKSGGWMNQATKEKSCGIVYNVVGRMKINTNSSIDNHQRPLINNLKVKESVLFGVDPRQPHQVSPRRELAAVVIPTNDETECLHEMEDFTKSSIQSPSKIRWHSDMQVKDHCNSTTVILPGAVHGLPNKGDLSPLIERWRSRGQCDCGGWDVGCKLCVLSDGGHHFQNSNIHAASHTSDHLELFLQGEDRSHEPVFSLTLLEKGAYSVTFSSSISLLQAFFICVTVLSCQTSSDLAKASNPVEDKDCRVSIAENEREKKTDPSTPRQAASKYAPCPPISPVSRV